MTEWDAAPLTRSGPKGGLRRDPTQLPAGFLDRLWQETWLLFAGYAHSAHRSRMRVLWGDDMDDVNNELAVLWLESAARFNGTGSFLGYAQSRLATQLTDVSRKQMGRGLSDLSIRVARLRADLGREATPEEAGCTPTRLRELEDWYATRFPQVWPDTTAMDEAVCRT